jgi:hypothetical protein
MGKCRTRLGKRGGDSRGRQQGGGGRDGSTAFLFDIFRFSILIGGRRMRDFRRGCVETGGSWAYRNLATMVSLLSLFSLFWMKIFHPHFSAITLLIFQ